MSAPPARIIETHTVEETLRLGERIGRQLEPGSVVALIGTLGSGKTHLVKGIARGNDAPRDLVVTSPTFVLVNEYAGRLLLYHVDAYRLHGAADLEALGFDEMTATGAAVLIEWADRVTKCLPPDHLRVEIEITGESDRRFTFTCTGATTPGATGSWATLLCPGSAPRALQSWSVGRTLHNWFERHRHPVSRVLHAVGIPMLIVGLLLGAWQLWQGMWSVWWRPVGLIGVSYILQGIGHAIEGNDMGEVVLLKKFLGRPYVAIAPRREAHDD